ncbi:MAG: BREX system P-loop protein BrxC [Clostridiaceae bacterium]|nr:BREX system P-loop protein BrxC [Clostridiaceae bacterium]
MRIGDMFVKPINRDIKGVIKVSQDDGANIFQELDEYVVTKELLRYIRDFFESYKKGISGSTDKMGVWISGFFGSGKSHFLKILSYLLANKEVNGKKAIEFFTDGKKIFDNMVIADINLAEKTSTDVILFNIDSKSAADSKSNKDAIVEVFMKVFDEMQGFCGSMPFLADLERKLVDDGIYETFKSRFKELNGNEWIEAREDFYFIQDDLIKVLADMGVMSEESARVWCEKSSETYNISIEKFADLVRRYCEKKGKNHHVVFLVDEMGQYIGDDSKLMLNLQTVTEDLGTMCGGKAWIVVTSQQEIDKITKVKGNDFSKITGRFDTRISLSSANVDEVIRKRILAKNETANKTLRLLYDQKESILKNLIIFTSDTAEKKMYSGRDDFAAVYPFIPYQFNLLGQVLTAIREHGASGKHLSEGERSMIALFKESAVSLMHQTEGVLVPFNTFYNALHKFIDHTHSTVITRAGENQYLNDFDVELLKILFMIKYVKEIKSNVDNLTTLIIGNIDDDRIALKKQVEESLKRLIKQTLVQKNGEIYIFLTNEEQDINRSIAQENVEMGEIINEASTVIFEDIFTEKKYRYNARYNFAFNQIVDDRYFKNNQSSDIGIKIITPYNDQEYSDATLRMLSSQENNIIIKLTSDTTFLDEITESLKINKFITKQGVGLPKSFDSIKRAKQDELIEKKERIRIFIEEALKNAEIYVNGDKANIGVKDPVSRINEALGKLVATRYNKLSYMETAPTLSDIDSIFRKSNQISFETGEEKTANKLALADMLQFIEMNTIRHTKTSLKALFERFDKAPYGFIELDIQWLIATLFKQGKVTFTINSQSVSLVGTDAAEIVRYITKREYIEKLLIEKREKATERQIKSVKEVIKDLFGLTTVSEEDDALIASFKSRSQNKLADIEKLLFEYKIESRFPGKSILVKAKDLLKQVEGTSDPMEFFKLVDAKKDDFLDIAEDISPIMSFFAGEQKGIFAKAWKYIDIFNNSKTYVVDRELIEVVDKIKAIVSKHNPYAEIHKLPALLDGFSTKHIALIEKEAGPIKDDLKSDKSKVVEALDAKNEYAVKFKEKFLNLFNELGNKLDTSNEIAAVKNIRYESDALKTRCLNEIAEYEKKLLEEEQRKQKEKNKEAGNTVVIPPVVIKVEKNISLKQITSGKTVTIEKEEDIDEFLKTLRTKLVRELEKDTVIKLLM